MNWSNETIERVALVKHNRECGHLSLTEQEAIWARDGEHLKADAKAALAAVAECSEVKALVEAGCLLCASIGCEKAENAASKRWSKALTPFTEASNG